MSLICFLVFVLLRSVGGADTPLAFHSFPAEDDNIVTLGDAAHNSANQSYIINGHATHLRGSCGAMFYEKKIRIQDVTTGRAASFTTSFSFTFKTLGLSQDHSSSPEEKDHSAIVFILFKSSSKMRADLQDLMSDIGRAGACRSPLHPSHPHHRYTQPGFFISFNMGRYNPISENACTSYIRVGKSHDYEYDIKAYTHNLCGNNTNCLYFSDGKIFTAWIDFNSLAQTLEVRLANGSNPSVKKPQLPLLRIPNYKLPEMLGDEVVPSIWASSNVQRAEVHELLSWEFFNSEISKVPSSQTPNHFWKTRTWAGASKGLLGLVVAAAIVILWCVSRLANPSKRYSHTPLGPNTGPHAFSYAELKMATHNFHERNLLGIGGSGSVYKGSFEIPNGTHFVAVKQINSLESRQAKSLFQAKVASLGQIRHRNVVQLQGWCQEKGRLLLVYDFMPNGGLNEWLHTHSSHGLQHQESVLSLERRHSILQGIGAALEYLHEDCLNCVLHRDIKSSNVLLDADFNAHLGDFGLARLMDHHKLDRTTLAAGTLGYMAPEVLFTGKATKESDVYSFGILVLEVVCGRHPLDLQGTKPDDLALLDIVWQAHEGGALLNVVDPRLLQSLQPLRSTLHQEDKDGIGLPPSPLDSNLGSANNVLGKSIALDVNNQVQATMVVDLLHLGLLCCLPNPKARPSMGQVNRILQQISNLENASNIFCLSMPSLPTTNPWRLYDLLKLSQSSPSLSSSSLPVFDTHSKLYIDSSSIERGFGNFRKDD